MSFPREMLRIRRSQSIVGRFLFNIERLSLSRRRAHRERGDVTATVLDEAELLFVFGDILPNSLDE